MRLPHTRLISIIVLSLAIVGLGAAFLVSQVSAQNDIASDLKLKLIQRNVPVEGVTVLGRLPFRIQIVIQSASMGSEVLPDDPLFVATARRGVSAARRQGTRVDAVSVIILNQQGETIHFSEIPVDVALDSVLPQPSKLDNGAVAQAVQGELHLSDISLDRLNVTQNAEGAQEVELLCSASNVETANREIPRLM